jgi:hypothetical protein
VIDEALVDGETKEPKTLASAAVMYVPSDLALELKLYLEGIDEDPQGWLFTSSRKSAPMRPGNFLNRVLKPAATRADIAIRKNTKGKDTTALNFQSPRRTSSTLFGDKARDPKSTPAHMRHSDLAGRTKALSAGDSSDREGRGDRAGNWMLEQKRKREARAPQKRPLRPWSDVPDGQG